eukprot:TRINITY_DN1612_c0_g1_i2.p1 TRINITY_DN1612_c0_g1~~TRINITY_DN1612_c0_g1_i2.p1  ORF type:complete len:305 (-),score=109.47 TRINITY_DN1612_c0_g1_i2:97-1011(-)
MSSKNKRGKKTKGKNMRGKKTKKLQILKKEIEDLKARIEEEVPPLGYNPLSDDKKDDGDDENDGNQLGPVVKKEFSTLPISKATLKGLKQAKYTKMTKIQQGSIIHSLYGRDILAAAKTGSGKTLAFLLPLLRHVMAQESVKQGEGPIGLILAPTRELATQIHSEVKKFTKNLGMRAVCVYGGAGVQHQIGDLKRGAEIVVCTPGRMIDILTTNGGRITNLGRVTFVILDEADRMFDMGFEPQIMRIIQNVRPSRQTVMFSATFPTSVEHIARRILTRPIEIVVGGVSVVCDDVKQIIEVREEY